MLFTFGASSFGLLQPFREGKLFSIVMFSAYLYLAK
jgi:hypothetical protein